MKKAHFTAIVQALDAAKVPFITVGGVAVNEHGYGRNTYDVDLVISLDREAIPRAFAALAALGYLPRVPITAEQFAQPEIRRGLIEEKQMKVLNFWSVNTAKHLWIFSLLSPSTFQMSMPALKIVKSRPECLRASFL